MRDVLFFGRSYCGACHSLMKASLLPLKEKYPHNVSIHYAWDDATERVNRRRKITHIPLFVIENHGEEEFRFSGPLDFEQLEEIVCYEGEALTLEDVLP